MDYDLTRQVYYMAVEKNELNFVDLLKVTEVFTWHHLKKMILLRKPRLEASVLCRKIFLVNYTDNMKLLEIAEGR